MTAEMAVMNKSAVALAADSAVTIETKGGQKIYNTVNKLFALSKYEPLAAMVYGSAELLQVPWEIIVKVYREETLDDRFETVEEAADDLVAWIQANETFFPVEKRLRFSAAVVASFLTDTVKMPMVEIIDELLSNGPVDLPTMKSVMSSCVGKMVDALDSFEASSISDEVAEETIAEDVEWFTAALGEVFENFPLGNEEIAPLVDLCRKFATKNFMGPAMSGLVVAGYGVKELYPTVTSFELGGFLGDRLRFGRATQSVTDDNGAAIMPFAQREMVDTFIQGMAPDLNDLLVGYLEGLTEELTEAVITENGGLDATAASQLKNLAKAGYHNFLQAMGDYMSMNYVMPVVSAVEVLPKEELAEVAESLVNLTSFKRRVSIGEVETVGGPIDVAIISKADGLIWIKRKHYFEPDLNPQFFANYYRSTTSGAGSND